MSIAPGDLDQRVILQTKSVTRNGIGEEVVSWGDVITSTSDHGVWAKAQPLRGREFFSANQMQQAVDVRFWIRERAGIEPDMRLLWKSDAYDITGVIPGTGPYRGFIEIMAVHGVRNGR